MRSGTFFFVLSLTLVVGLAVMSCSDNPTTTTPPSDQMQNYEAVQAEANEFIDSTIGQLAYSLQLASVTIPMDTAVSVVFSPINPDSVHTSNNWLVVFASDLAAAYSWNRIDSMQFRRYGSVQDSVRGADAISLRHHFNLEYANTTGAYRNRDANATFELTGLNTTTATINGHREATVQTRTINGDVEWNREFTIYMAFKTLTVNRDNNGWETGCPHSGTITGLIQLSSARGDDTPVQTSWTFEISLDDGVATATVVSGSLTNTYTRNICQ